MLSFQYVADIEMKRVFHKIGHKRRDNGAPNEFKDTPCDNTYSAGAPQTSTALSPAECLTQGNDKPSRLISHAPASAPIGAATGFSSAPSSNQTPSAPTSQNDAHGRQSNTISSSTNTTKKNYWQLAIESLQEEDPSVADQILGVQQAATETGSTDFAAQLLHATKERQQALEAKRWKITTSSGEVVLRDQLDRLSKVVTVFKGVATAAGSLDPVHAGLPLAGFCALMRVSAIASSPQQ